MAAATCSMARSITGDLIWLAVVTAATLRTYWRAADTTSSWVAGGSRPRSGVMFRHMGPTIRAPPLPAERGPPTPRCRPVPSTRSASLDVGKVPQTLPRAALLDDSVYDVRAAMCGDGFLQSLAIFTRCSHDDMPDVTGS